jgi:hypothetical protein
MRNMDARARSSLVLHGILVIVLGLLAGFPYALVISGDLTGELRAWRMAHLEGVLNGLLMLGVGAAGSLLVLSPGKTRLLVISLLVAGYGNVVASTLGAALGVRGLSPSGPAANLVVFLLFTAAIAGVFVGLGLAVVGALHSRRSGD